jgi:hypothetical protein
VNENFHASSAGSSGKLLPKQHLQIIHQVMASLKSVFSKDESTIVIEVSEQVSEFRSECYRYVRMLHNFQFYVLISPYRIICEQNGCSRLVTSAWRKVISNSYSRCLAL